MGTSQIYNPLVNSVGDLRTPKVCLASEVGAGLSLPLTESALVLRG